MAQERMDGEAVALCGVALGEELRNVIERFVERQQDAMAPDQMASCVFVTFGGCVGFFADAFAVDDRTRKMLVEDAVKVARGYKP